MLVKIIVIAIFLLILYNLASALVYMLKDKSKSDRMAKALMWRISLSLAAFILLMVAYAVGLIQPHGILPPPPQ
ncbi:MAG TPA: twin transmembrane helix small protein [Gammaproteobacteria bacterium]|jgi:hypothetical protein